MIPSVLKKLEDEALKLSPRSRARLAERLIASLEAGPREPDADESWVAEAVRRADELAGGKIAGVPARKTLAKARDALR